MILIDVPTGKSAIVGLSDTPVSCNKANLTMVTEASTALLNAIPPVAGAVAVVVVLNVAVNR